MSDVADQLENVRNVNISSHTLWKGSPHDGIELWWPFHECTKLQNLLHSYVNYAIAPTHVGHVASDHRGFDKV